MAWDVQVSEHPMAADGADDVSTGAVACGAEASSVCAAHPTTAMNVSDVAIVARRNVGFIDPSL
jgi:hypothetical protein